MSELPLEKVKTALRIIQTWAACDDMSTQSREQAMQDIVDKCKQTLKDLEHSSIPESKDKLFVKGYEIFALNEEVHVIERGPNKFYTVRKVEANYAGLSLRHNKKIIFYYPTDSCYFTTRSAKRVLRLHKNYQNNLVKESVTKIRVYQKDKGWRIDAANDNEDLVTKNVWCKYDNQYLTQEKALSLVFDFCKHIGRPDLVNKVQIYA